MTGLVIPISGPYTGTWNAGAIGTLNDAGYELQATFQGQEINETDAYGMTLVEAIWRGMNWRCRIRGLEWNKSASNTTGLLGLLQMFGVGAGGFPLEPTLTAIGDRWSKYCQALVLTAILGNPPTTPQSLTALGAGLAPQQQSTFNMTSKCRELPVELVFLPYVQSGGSESGATVPFSVT